MVIPLDLASMASSQASLSARDLSCADTTASSAALPMPKPPSNVRMPSAVEKAYQEYLAVVSAAREETAVVDPSTRETTNGKPTCKD